MGASYLGKNIEVWPPTAASSSSGCRAGTRAEIDLGAMMRRRISLISTALRSRPALQKAAIVAAFSAGVVPASPRAGMRPVVDRILPLDEAAEAHRLMEAGEAVGKIVLDASDPCLIPTSGQRGCAPAVTGAAPDARRESQPPGLDAGSDPRSRRDPSRGHHPRRGHRPGIARSRRSGAKPPDGHVIFSDISEPLLEDCRDAVAQVSGTERSSFVRARRPTSRRSHAPRSTWWWNAPCSSSSRIAREHSRSITAYCAREDGCRSASRSTAG